MDKRPNLDKHISLKDFSEFYWLKEELTQFCRQEGIKQAGSKIELTKRIQHFLSTGEKTMPNEVKAAKPQSTFDWKSSPLTLDTIITDNYKNNRNVRHFFQQYLGKQFRFNIRFMEWMQMNTGKTLADAVEAYQLIKLEEKQLTSPKQLPPSLEYNRYIRDFSAANPNKSLKLGIQLWKLKKAQRGDNKYQDSDFEMLK